MVAHVCICICVSKLLRYDWVNLNETVHELCHTYRDY